MWEDLGMLLARTSYKMGDNPIHGSARNILRMLTDLMDNLEEHNDHQKCWNQMALCVWILRFATSSMWTQSMMGGAVRAATWNQVLDYVDEAMESILKARTPIEATVLNTCASTSTDPGV